MTQFAIFDNSTGALLGVSDYPTAADAARDLLSDAFKDPRDGKSVMVAPLSECRTGTEEDGPGNGMLFGPENGGEVFR